MQINSKHKHRVLSVFTLVMINVIAIDSLRNLSVNAQTGLSIGFFYIIAGIFFLIPCMLITAELATHYPKTGGVYVWVREAFGPHWGFFTIWLQWIYNVFWYPTILSFIAANIAYLIDPNLANNKLFMLPMVIGMFLIATIVNAFGMKVSSWVSIISAIFGTLIPMLFIIGLGIVWLCLGKPLAITPTPQHFLPNITHDNNLAFIVVVIFSLMGLEMSAVHAEEVQNPQRDYPKALYYSGLIIALTMILASSAIAIIVPEHSLNIYSGLDQALELFLKPFHLHWLMPVMILLIILGSFGGMAAWIIGPTKSLMVAADDGNIPTLLHYKNRHGVPMAVLILQAIIVLVLCGLFLLYPTISTTYWILSDLTAQLALLFYVVFFAAAIRLRYKTAKQSSAYRIPFKNVGIWVVGLMGAISCLIAMIVGFIPPESVAIGSVALYEVILWVGVIVFTLIPWMIVWMRRQQQLSPPPLKKGVGSH